MSIRRLYVIGNGFDLHHDINCSYGAFHEWLKANGYFDDNDIESYFTDNNGLIVDLWSSFEENLAFFNCNAFARHVTSENPPDVTSEHFERTLSDARCEVENQLSEWSQTIRKGLACWVAQLNEPNHKKKIDIKKSDSFFITFNYTKTLEKLYGIPSNSILHIHGQAGDPANELLLGHGGIEKQKRYDEDLAEGDIDGSELMAGEDAANSAFGEIGKWQKPVDQTLCKYADYFEALKNVDEVFVLGYSFSKIDQPYIDKVLAVVSPSARWTVSWFSNEDKIRCRKALVCRHISLVTLSELQADVSLGMCGI